LALDVQVCGGWRGCPCRADSARDRSGCRASRFIDRPSSWRCRASSQTSDHHCSTRESGSDPPNTGRGLDSSSAEAHACAPDRSAARIRVHVARSPGRPAREGDTRAVAGAQTWPACFDWAETGYGAYRDGRAAGDKGDRSEHARVRRCCESSTSQRRDQFGAVVARRRIADRSGARRARSTACTAAGRTDNRRTSGRSRDRSGDRQPAAHAHTGRIVALVGSQ